MYSNKPIIFTTTLDTSTDTNEFIANTMVDSFSSVYNSITITTGTTTLVYVSDDPDVTLSPGVTKPSVDDPTPRFYELTTLSPGEINSFTLKVYPLRHQNWNTTEIKDQYLSGKIHRIYLFHYI